MPNVARHRLFWKYAAWLAGLVSALLILSGGIGGYFAYRQSIDAQEELQREKARAAAAEIVAFVSRIEDALQAAADKFSIDEAADIENLRIELIAMLRHQPAITELHWIGSDGHERLALSRVARDDSNAGEDRSDDARFKGARAARRYVGPIYFVRESEPYVSLAASHDPRSPVLVAEVNLKFVADVISIVRTAPAGIAYIIDSHGRLAAHTDMGLVLSRADLSGLPQVRRALAATQDASSVGEARSLDGSPVLAAATPIQRLGWTVFVEQSRAEALRPVYASVLRTVALVLIGVTAAVVASLALARRMVHPIRKIEAGAREIGEGKLERRIDVKTGDELEALGAQFNDMAERLQAIYASQEARIAERTRELALANEAKSRFLAAASHDLRQPMHALALFVGQLRAEGRSAQAAVLMERIEHSVGSLGDLLDALLDLSKLDTGAVTAQPRPFPAQDLLSRLVSDFNPLADAKGLVITLVPTSLWLCSDPLLLERILLNVIANAIRYTHEGRILVGCRRRGEWVDVVVADTGVGIAPVHLPKVFDEFYQVESRQTGVTKSLGLGLAIVKRLAGLLDHPVAIRSALARGTTVCIRVPRAQPQRSERPPEASGMLDLNGTHVLVVDDDPAAREAVQGILRQWGCEVVTASAGNEAIERARDWPVDVVLCDLDLGGDENGLDVLIRLQREHGGGLTCGFVTGESSSESVAQVRARGYPIVFKPVKPAKLRALIEHLRASSVHSLHGNEVI